MRVRFACFLLRVLPTEAGARAVSHLLLSGFLFGLFLFRFFSDSFRDVMTQESAVPAVSSDGPKLHHL